MNAQVYLYRDISKQ